MEPSSGTAADCSLCLVEAARGLLAGLAPLHRAVDQCVVHVAYQNEKTGQKLNGDLRYARAKMTELGRAVEKLDGDAVRGRGGSSLRGAGVYLETSYEGEESATDFSNSTHKRGASLNSSPTLNASLIDACAVATSTYRQVLKNIAPYLSSLGPSLDPRQLRALLANTHSAAAEFKASWDSMTILLSGKSPPFSSHSFPTSTQQALGAGAERSHDDVSAANERYLNPHSDPLSSFQLPDTRICSAAEVATAVADGVLSLLDKVPDASLHPEHPGAMDDFVKHVPLAKLATERLSQALSRFGSLKVSEETTSSSHQAKLATAGADRTLTSEQILAGKRLLDEADNFVNSIIRFASLAKQMTMIAKQDEKKLQDSHRAHSLTLSRTTMSGIAMVTRVTKDLAVALKGCSPINNTNVL